MAAMRLFLLGLNVSAFLAISKGEVSGCYGGSSLLGVNKLADDYVECCDDFGNCHGYNAPLVERMVLESVDNLPKLNSTTIRHRSTRSADVRITEESQGLQLRADSGVTNETICCPNNATVFFPLSGISATTMKRVPVLQIKSFKQAVIYNRCLQNECRVLRGNCTQILLPQLVYILSAKNDTLMAEADFIFVEAGCECKTNWQHESVGVSRRFGADSGAAEALNLITGFEMKANDMALLAETPSASRTTPDDAASRPKTNVISKVANISRTLPPNEANDTLIDASDQSEPLDDAQVKSQIKNSGTNRIERSVEYVASTIQIDANDVLSSQSNYQFLQLPDLPMDKYPVLIRQGCYNPLLLTIEKYLASTGNEPNQ